MENTYKVRKLVIRSGIGIHCTTQYFVFSPSQGWQINSGHHSKTFLVQYYQTLERKYKNPLTLKEDPFLV